MPLTPLKITKWRPPFLIAFSVALLMSLGSHFNLLLTLESQFRDRLFQLRSPEPKENKILVVTIDDNDLVQIGDWPIPDAVLAQLIVKLRQYKPRAIGLDLFRDLPEEPGHQELQEVFRTTPTVIGVENVLGTRVAPPKTLKARGQIALTHVVLDSDLYIRRALLSAKDPQTDEVKLTLGVRTALMYLEQEEVHLEILNAKHQQMKLGEAIFTPLRRGDFGYNRPLGGYQVLMNWRGGRTAFDTISLTEILAGSVDASLIRDRIILVGSTADTTNDFFATPYKDTVRGIAGVFVQANLASMMLNSALYGRALFPAISAWEQRVWIIAAALLGAGGSWYIESLDKKHRGLLTGMLTLSSSLIFVLLFFAGSYFAFVNGILIPIVIPTITFILSTGIAVNRYKQLQLHQVNCEIIEANQKLEQYSQTLEKQVEARTAELLKSNEQLSQAKESADIANAAKSKFLSNMSHELRTPLNAILGFTQLMQRNRNLPVDISNNLSTINRSGEHLLALINDVLDMAKIESGRILLNPQPFDLLYFLSDLQQLMQVRAEKKLLDLVFEYHDIPQYIDADEGKLRQVLTNLIDNAIKFTEQGSVMVCAHLRSKNRLAFEVKDTGIGIAPDEVEILFNAFVQSSSNYRSQEGTGLGLAISRQLVKMMGGDIFVQSNSDEGSIFHFEINFELANTTDIGLNSSFKRVLGLAEGQTSKRILVVDDALESRTLLIQLLQNIGFEAKEAINGKEALDIWKEWRPDLIFMDLWMPIMNGDEAAKVIATQDNPTTKVIAITADALEMEQGKKLNSSGFIDVMSKPFQAEELFQMIAKYLDVEFCYEEINSESVQMGHKTLTKSDLSVLSPDWVKDLHNFAASARMEVIKEHIAIIAEDHRDIADGLNRLTDQFRFDVIASLTSSNDTQ